ncbi:hypothetical protein [Aromatoleum aromaticum]|nr:hypothetical protein [Aromatoleum aromaticum]
MDDFQSALNAAIDTMAADIDMACKRRLRDTKWNLALEREPCLKGAVSLRRIVHALALRAAESVQEGRPEFRLHPNERWRWKYHRYLVAVVRLNAALAEAARRGGFRVRDSLTRLPADNIELPNTETILQWERAALPDTRTPESKRRAAELMTTFNGWLLCGEHFSASLVVDLAEFSAWAEAEGIVTRGEIAERLSAIEDEFMAMQAIAQDSRMPSEDQKQSDPQDDADAPTEHAAPEEATPPGPPPLIQKWQESEILRVLRERGYDPQRLPRGPAGTPGPKAEVRASLDMTPAVFKKAWERLRWYGDIADA